MKFLKSFPFIVNFIFSGILFSPRIFFSQVNDAGLWLSAGIEKKINSKVSICLNPTFRFNENITELGSVFADIGSEYKLNKRIRFALNYRFVSRRNIDDSYGLRHRFYADFSYRKKINRISFTYRLRMQNQYTDLLSSEDGRNPDYAIRNKLQLKYETDTKYSPFVSGEIWYGINYEEKLFNRYRLVAGLNYEINKYSSIVLSYIFQREFNTSNPETDYITSIGYNYSF